MNIRTGILVFFFSLIFFGCLKPPDYSVVPALTFKSLNKSSFHEPTIVDTLSVDTLKITFSFKDGDGDLGLDQSSTDYDCFLTDSRFPSVPPINYRIPDITPQSNVKAISGEIIINIPGVYRRFGFPTDTLSYFIQIKDRAGNMSNKIKTDRFSVI